MPITPQIGAKKYSKYVSWKLSEGACTWKGQKYTKKRVLGAFIPNIGVTIQNAYFNTTIIVTKRPFFDCGS